MSGHPTHITFFSSTGESPDAIGSRPDDDRSDVVEISFKLGISKERALLALRAAVTHIEESSFVELCDLVATQGLGSMTGGTR